MCLTEFVCVIGMMKDSEIILCCLLGVMLHGQYILISLHAYTTDKVLAQLVMIIKTNFECSGNCSS